MHIHAKYCKECKVHALGPSTSHQSRQDMLELDGQANCPPAAPHGVDPTPLPPLHRPSHAQCTGMPLHAKHCTKCKVHAARPINITSKSKRYARLMGHNTIRRAPPSLQRPCPAQAPTWDVARRALLAPPPRAGRRGGHRHRRTPARVCARCTSPLKSKVTNGRRQSGWQARLRQNPSDGRWREKKRSKRYKSKLLSLNNWCAFADNSRYSQGNALTTPEISIPTPNILLIKVVSVYLQSDRTFSLLTGAHSKWKVLALEIN